MFTKIIDDHTEIKDIFPSLIYRTRLDVDIEKMCNFIAGLANDLSPKVYDAWYGHFSMPSLEIIDPMFIELKQQIEYHANKFYKLTHQGPRTQLESKRMWGVVFKQGGNMRPHTHHECLYSSCFYLKNNHNGRITFTHPSQLRFNATIDYAPDPGELLIWPGWLLHEVPPIKDNAERVSIATKIDFLTPRASFENRQVDPEYI